MHLPTDDYFTKGFWKNQNIYSYLQKAAEKVPTKIAAVDSFQKLTYEQLNGYVKQLAGSFKNVGIQKGDVVSFQLPNWMEAIIVHQALSKIGAISNPIIPLYREKELTYILNQSKTKLMIIPYSFRNFNYLKMLQQLIRSRELEHLETLVLIDKYNEEPELDSSFEIEFNPFLERGAVDNKVEKVNEKNINLLLYTSGTTSDPKGVLHSHNTLIHENNTIVELYRLNNQDTIFMPSPVTHITGFLYGLELAFMIEGKVVLQDIWDPVKAIKLLADEQCTWTVGATPFLKGIVQSINEEQRQQLKLKAFACGGADVPPELVREAAEKLKCCVTRVYGSSEYPTFSACSYEDPIDKAAHTDGKLFKGSKGRIVNERKEEVPFGEIGELAVQGPEMFLGYLQDKNNKEAFTEEGYFLTGDLAMIDSEGYIEIKGRKKDIIIRGGENISVKEIEDILFTHENIQNVVIVAMPDKEMGEKACAFVVLKEGVQFDFKEMTDFLKKTGVAKQKLPERLEIIEKMPMTASGKIQKFVLRERISQGSK
ncbi:AMP-binding protein [Alteribacillus sp. JSM 102045]|uniref:AMP-binding protein n=1 Tax=Alteribacillus sp. JSM 102045 TaxID=1562101 RepID=UPI0035BF2FD8